MQEKDGWKRVRASIPDSRIISRATKKARANKKHSKIYVRGAHYEYLFEKVGIIKSIIYRSKFIIYRRRLKHQKRLKHQNVEYYLYKIKEYSSVSKVLSIFKQRKKAIYVAQKMSLKSHLPIFVIWAHGLREANSVVSGYSEDLDDPSEYKLRNRAVKHTICYFIENEMREKYE